MLRMSDKVILSPGVLGRQDTHASQSELAYPLVATDRTFTIRTRPRNNAKRTRQRIKEMVAVEK